MLSVTSAMDVVTTMLSQLVMLADARRRAAGKWSIAIAVAEYITATLGDHTPAGLINGDAFVTPSAAVAA